MEIIIILIGIGILFINEKEPIYSIIWYVSIIIIMILNISWWNNEYLILYSYIIIIINLSALIILFSFVILLSTNIKTIKRLENKMEISMIWKIIILISIIGYIWKINNNVINEYEIINESSKRISCIGDNENILNIIGSKIYNINKYIYSLVLISILLLIGLIGSLIILI